MTNSYINREHDSASTSHKKHFSGTILFSLIFLLFFSQIGLSESLTFHEAIKLSLSRGINASITIEQEAYLNHKEKALEEEKTERLFLGKTGYSKNEVADSRDLEGSATQTNQINLSYRETYQNGFSWTISQTFRKENAITSNTEDQDYQKTLLYLKMPIYGKESSQNRLKIEQSKIKIDGERFIRQAQQATVQYQAARAFLEAALQENLLESTILKERVYGEKIKQKLKRPADLPPIEKELLELEQLQEKQNINLQQSQLNQAKLKLEIYTGDLAQKQLPLPEELPELSHSLDQITDQYIENSVKIKQLEQRIQILQKDMKLRQLDEGPDISVGGYLGRSTLNDTEGNNFGINLSLTYKLGGALRERTETDRREINRLQLEIKLEQEREKIAARQDVQQLLARQTKLKLLESKYQTIQKKSALAKRKFEIGISAYDELADSEIETINAKNSWQEAKVDTWLAWLNLAEKLNQPLVNISD